MAGRATGGSGGRSPVGSAARRNASRASRSWPPCCCSPRLHRLRHRAGLGRHGAAERDGADRLARSLPLTVAVSLGILPCCWESRRVEARARRLHRQRAAIPAWPWRPPAAASGNGTSPKTASSCRTSPLPSLAGAVAWSTARRQVLERVLRGPPRRAGARRCPRTAWPVYGGFDVSFRVAQPGLGRPAGVGSTLAARASARAPRAAIRLDHRRCRSTSLEERLAPGPRPGRRDLRLRDAIESVSEAFVLWDKQAPFADVQQELPQLLPPGAAGAEAGRRARGAGGAGQARRAPGVPGARRPQGRARGRAG